MVDCVASLAALLAPWASLDASLASAAPPATEADAVVDARVDHCDVIALRNTARAGSLTPPRDGDGMQLAPDWGNYALRLRRGRA